MRNITDEVADMLAPGLTNRTRDARWLTLLAWSLVASDQAWRKVGGSDISNAATRAERYAWLRPLELLWVARSMHIGGKSYRAAQWPGSRSLARWDHLSPRFSMTGTQLTNHRQLGAYGAYRVLFRQQGFTLFNDGWTPADSTLSLAKFVTETLSKEGAAPTWQNKPRHPDPAHWWITTGWPQWRTPCKESKLLLSGIQPTKLHQEEIQVLLPLLFADKSDRLRTAEAIGATSASADYVGLCNFLSRKLPAAGGNPSLSRLGVLADLHDAGVQVLRTIAQCCLENSVTVTVLARDRNLVEAHRRFVSCAMNWREHEDSSPLFSHQVEADRLAKVSIPSTQAFLHRFITHHEAHSSGTRWFALDGDTIVSIGAESSVAGGDFGYRLHALARLAVQCGVLKKLPRALVENVREEGVE
jgi:hypothetical protein